jgi:hypothetical protein
MKMHQQQRRYLYFAKKHMPTHEALNPLKEEETMATSVSSCMQFLTPLSVEESPYGLIQPTLEF